MLKTKTITTDKATVLVVEIPNGKYIRCHKGYIVQSCSSELDLLNKCKKIDKGDTNGFIHIGNWQLIGRLPDITEEQAKLIVPEYHIERLYATESVYDLLKDNDVYFENKYDNKYFLGSEEMIHHVNELKREQAQSKVWDKEWTYLLK